jgi:hypothetical protein
VPQDIEHLRLIVGNRIRCPKDRTLRNMFSYKTFEVEPEFADELNVILKCPSCGHLFSPTVSASTIRRGIQVGEVVANVA